VPLGTVPPAGPPPRSIELGPTGSPLGLGTAADFDAEASPAKGALRLRPLRAGAAGRAGTARAIRWAIRRRRRRRTGLVAPPLLQNEAFRTFWLARLTAQTAQGALFYAFLLVVADRTDSAFFNSLFVVSSILPSIAFGLPAGIVVDSLPRRPLLVMLNTLRFIFAAALVMEPPSLPGVFAATLALWTIHQFYSPSESAALTALVPRERYANAQALSNLALTLAQLLGLVILAPLLLKTAGPRALFAVCAAFFFVAAGLSALLPRLDEHVGRVAAGSSRRGGGLRSALLDGWRTARADDQSYGALISDVLIGIGMSSLVVIMPLYLKRVLDTSAENTVFVFAPAALGLVLGLRYAPRISHAIGEQRVATSGLVGFALCVGALGFVVRLRELAVDLRLPLDQIADLAGIPSLVLIAMLLSVPAGFASALVSVAARSLLLARTPPSRRGQVIATQALIGNLGALIPTLLAGVAADLFGVEPIAIAIAVVLTGAMFAARLVRPPLVMPSTSPSA